MTGIETTRGIVETVFYAVGVAAAGLSVLEYRKNSSRERTRWLFELYQLFYGSASEIKKTWKRMERERLPPGHIDDLLNFFEFIAILRTRRELESEEIEDMFAYPLRSLAADEAVRRYLDEYDYEHLAALLRELGYTPKRVGKG